MRIANLTPVIGAEILDVDLADLNGDLVETIREALLDRLVVFFREQSLTPQQLIDFVNAFGEIEPNNTASTAMEQHPEISVLAADETSTQVAGETFHADGTGFEKPPLGTVLHMQQVPDNGGGDTIFANMYAAYDALTEELKDFLDGLTAIHDRAYALRGFKAALQMRSGETTQPVAEHPVVRVHPETGRKLLYVNRAYTREIPQLNKLQSDALLESLFRHIELPLFQCRFKWAVGSIAFWDNRSAQHYAVWDYHPYRRRAHRITLRGDRPVGPEGRRGKHDLVGVPA